MNFALIARPLFALAVQAAEFVFDHFVRRPLQGLMGIAEALAQLLPDLTEAAVAAVIQAVSAQLSPAGRARVAQGFQQLWGGLKLLAWPIGLGVLLAVYQVSGVIWLLSLGAAMLYLIGWSTLIVHVVTVP